MQTNTTRILNFAFAIGFCLRIYNITIYFPFARYICLKNQFLSQNHLRYKWKMVEVRRLLGFPEYLLAR